MRTFARSFVVILTAVHGLIHLLGAAKGLGWAEVATLREPISGPMGLLWLLAAVLVLGAAAALAVEVRGWWVVTGLAAVVSQAVIVTAWSDARAGTAVNVLLLLVSTYGYASRGPRSFRAEYLRRADAALAEPARTDFVTEADLARLPDPVAGYVRQSGAVGHPHVHSFHASVHGRIRGGVDKPWMRFTGEQVNTYGDHPRRLFRMDATMAGLPVDVLHLFDEHATMRVRAASVVPMVDAAGRDMDRAETVTMFNDLCVLAPAALVDAPVQWEVLDEHRVRGTFTHGNQTVRAELLFDDDHRLVDFVSDDRLRSSSDGHSFTPQRWSTPIGGYRDFGSRRIGATGEAHWHAPSPEGEFGYLEFVVDDIAYDAPAPAR